MLDGIFRFFGSVIAPEPGEPLLEEIKRAKNARPESDSNPNAEEESESERGPKHPREPRVFSHTVELLGRVVVEQETAARESEERNEEGHPALTGHNVCEYCMQYYI